jgi:hypothetical protein
VLAKPQHPCKQRQQQEHTQNQGLPKTSSHSAKRLPRVNQRNQNVPKHGINSFRGESALVVEIGWAIGLIEQEVSTIKVRIAGDFRYPAKILYAFEICIQHWLCLCEQQEDQLTINNRIIDMDQVIKQILNSSLTIDLPNVFITDATNPTQKKEEETPTPT